MITPTRSLLILTFDGIPLEVNMFSVPTSFEPILRGLLLPIIVTVLLIVIVRLIGLRSFSKMTNFDFVITIAVGSLLASACQSTSWSSYVQVLVSITTLFLFQFVVATLRRDFKPFKKTIENKPVILAWKGNVLHKSLKSTRVTYDDLTAKLREANVLDMKKVQAVVLETTGDISVIHGESECSEELLRGTKYPD